MNKMVLKVTQIILYLVFAAGVVITISVPWLVKWWQNVILRTGDNYLFLTLMLIVMGVASLVLLYELIMILKDINKGNPFVIKTVNRLNVMAISSFIITIAYIAKIIVMNSFFTMIIMLVFAMATLFSKVLAEVFRQAVIVKEENDLTI